ncbi:MAG: lactate utilization protein [Desulfobacterium sp.]|nr:lactate utilization protein [Desulfobacterium sp.]
METATAASARIHRVNSLEEAFQSTLDLCKSATNSEQSMIAAPEFEESEFARFQGLAKDKGVTLIKERLRDHANGIAIGFTRADLGIAETGTLVVSSNSEDLRLATMVSDIHVAVVKMSDIGACALDMADKIRALTTNPSSYTAFITGPSRTADIERVLAIGVHGPLELHIMLLEK